MKFSVLSTELTKSLSKIIGVVPPGKSPALPILENVLLELDGNELRLTASDMEMTMTTTLVVEGTENGSTTVPAKRLNDMLRALPSIDLSFTADPANQRVTVRTPRGEYKMAGESAVNYPEREAMTDEVSIIIQASLLRNVIGKTLFAASTDDLRPAMTGVLFQWKDGEFRAVATDGHRLVLVKHKGALSDALSSSMMEVIIPSKTLTVILKNLEDGEVTLTFARNNMRFAMDGLLLQSRIIDERYPNYESVIPIENAKELLVHRQALLAAERRVAIFANSVTNLIRLAITSDELRVSAENMDFGGEAEESLEASWSESEPMEIGFNAKYLDDALNHLDNEQVKFYFSTATRAGLIRPALTDEDFDIMMLVMPLRLNS